MDGFVGGDSVGDFLALSHVGCRRRRLLQTFSTDGASTRRKNDLKVLANPPLWMSAFVGDFPLALRRTFRYDPPRFSAGLCL